MQVADLQVIKDIPGFKVILKAILKSQMQQMVEQLAEFTGEESVLLTASVSDGSLSHLGSESGKVFLEDHEDIKSQFLGFCLKRHHRQNQLNIATTNDILDTGGGVGGGPVSPRKFGPGSKQRVFRPHTMIPSPQTHPVSLVKSSSKPSRGTSKSVRHDPYQINIQRQPAPRPILNERIEPLGNDSENRYPSPRPMQSLRIDPLIDQSRGNLPIKFDSYDKDLSLDDVGLSKLKEAVKVKLEGLESDAIDSDKNSETYDDAQMPSRSPQVYSIMENVGHSDSSETECSGKNQELKPSESYSRLGNEHESEFSNASRGSGDTDNEFYLTNTDRKEIKVEALTESEMELEIAGVDRGNVPKSSENWVSNIQDMIGSIPAASGPAGQGELTPELPYHRNSPLRHGSPVMPHHNGPSPVQPLMSSEGEGRWSKFNSDSKRVGFPRLLPESATQVMKAWLFRNIMNPYPSDDVKKDMSRQTNLSIIQINNWFTNARRRIIQPMLDSNNTKEAIEKLARYTSHHRTWSFSSDPEAADTPKNMKSPQDRPPVSHPVSGTDNGHGLEDSQDTYDPMEPDDLSIKKSS